MAQETQKKEYTYVSGVEAKDEQNGDFTFVTIFGIATRAEARKSPKAPVTASMPIKNRTKTVNKLMGTNFTEDTIWCRLNFWTERDGDFFLKYMNGRKSARVLVSGKLSKHEYNGNLSLDLNVFNWQGVPTKKPDENAGNNKTTPPAPPTAAEAGGFTQISDFDMGDDELPF